MKTTFEIKNFYWGTLNLVDSKININAALILPNDPFLILTSKDNTVYFSNTTHLFNSLFWLYRAFNILPSVHSLLLIPCRLGCWFAVSLICLFLKKKKIFLFTLNSRVNNFIWLDIDLFSYSCEEGTNLRLRLKIIWYKIAHPEPLLFSRGGTLEISGWGRAAGTMEPLTYTRASSAEFCYPIPE